MNRNQARIISLSAAPRRGGLAGVTDIDLNTRQVVVGRWVSWTGTAVTTAADMVTELERLGQATATLPTRDSVYNFAGGVPYTTQLRAIREWRRYIAERGAWIRSAYFYALDTTLTGSALQDAATVAAIKAPASPTNAPVRSSYLTSEIPVTWMPNNFAPKIIVDGTDILANSQQAPIAIGVNAAMESLGQTLPVVYDDIYYRVRSGVKSINVEAAVCQWIIDSALWQRYPVICEIEFLV